MIVTIHPSSLKGKIIAPASKSSMQKGLRVRASCDGASRCCTIPGHSHDDLAALDTISKLGAQVSGDPGLMPVTHSSRGVRPGAPEINCGESGLGVRMFTPIAALSGQPLIINGSGSLLTRPLHFFDEIFPQLGIRISSRNGFLPLHIQGPLKPASITVDGSLSSQFLTGLLMAFAAAGASEGISITVDNLKSKPYIDLTLKVLGDFGWNVTHEGHRHFYFGPPIPWRDATRGGRPSDDPLHYTVEGDWSGAAFLLVAGAIAGPVDVNGLDLGSTQADRAVLTAHGRIRVHCFACNPKKSTYRLNL